MNTAEPREEYAARLKARRGVAERYERMHIGLGNLRLAVALTAAGIAWAAWSTGRVSAWWLIAPAGIFVALMVVHDRVLGWRRLAGRAVVYYEQGVARLEDRWSHFGETGERFSDDVHPYARDLDLFGHGSLFQLLSAARTGAGENTLARWLMNPASPGEIRERQAAVAELRNRLDLREDLAVLGETAGSGVHAEALAAWGEAPAILGSARGRLMAAGLAALAIVAAVYWGESGIRWPFVVVLALEGVFFFLHRPRILRVIGQVEHPAHDLALLRDVLVRLERERFEAPLLVRLRDALDVGGQPPSKRLGRLAKLTDILDSRDNVVVRALGPVVLYTTQVAFAIDAWRRTSGPHLRTWLDSVGEMEALSSLAGYAYEHPTDVFPEIVDGAACFSGEGLCHPLLPAARSVANDVSVGSEPAVLIVSGSNMSGKSTLLRTTGLNAVLAMAGSVVRARRLSMTPLAVGASIRVVDSIQTGVSRFYAEIKRIRSFVDMASGTPPLLFLLDELLHGTNSHDRRIGAEAIIRGLIGRGAIGLVTTHDLALSHIAEEAPGRAANVHFEDHLEDGKITFDYHLRPGVVRKSNALELMRSVGLDV